MLAFFFTSSLLRSFLSFVSSICWLVDVRPQVNMGSPLDLTNTHIFTITDRTVLQLEHIRSIPYLVEHPVQDSQFREQRSKAL